jgi:membrane associated rhomboid family serine protease
VLPIDYALGPEYPLLTVLWLFGMAVPLGFWSRASAPRAWLGPLLLIALALGGISAALGLPLVSWWGWAAALGGLAGGWWLRERLGPARRFQSPPRARSASAP